MRAFVLGGTSEGRRLAAWLATCEGCSVVVSCATEYGGSLVPAADNVSVLEERLDARGMEQVVRGRNCDVVVDATHPYAVLASENAQAAAQAAGVPYVRVVREEDDVRGAWTCVPDAQAAAACVRAHDGRVLLATGTKDLPTFVGGVPDFAERVYVRVLPVTASLAKTEALGIPASHVIAMQGPFSTRLNEAVLREIGATLLVTKASGAAGGFAQKIEAARACDCDVVVISRPVHERGVSLEGAKEVLRGMMGEGAEGREA